jgi:hypothetical protein
MRHTRLLPNNRTSHVLAPIDARLAFGRAVLFSLIIDDFRPAGRKSSINKEVKYLAAAGKSGFAATPRNSYE